MTTGESGDEEAMGNNDLDWGDAKQMLDIRGWSVCS
jgi:hypothetical protein